MLPLAQRNVFHSLVFWLGALYVSFPMGLLLYGWNDIVDYEADRLNPRKGTFLFGARGTPEQLRRLPLRIALVQVPFVVACSVLAGPKLHRRPAHHGHRHRPSSGENPDGGADAG